MPSKFRKTSKTIEPSRKMPNNIEILDSVATMELVMADPQFSINGGLIQACTALTPNEREPLKLRYVDEKKVFEIADHYGKSKGTVSPDRLPTPPKTYSTNP